MFFCIRHWGRKNVPANLELLFAIFIVVADAVQPCYTPGPAFPVPFLLANNSLLGSLQTELDAVIAESLVSQLWNTSTTSFAVQLTSGDETLWSSYFTAPILGKYKDSEPRPVTGDTAFRAASISKSFTVYALLLEQGINLEDPITKYLPALNEGREDGWGPTFDQITIRSLASQLSGIARETGQMDLAVDSNTLHDPERHGFPPIRTDDTYLAPCGKTLDDKPCDAKDIVNVARKRASVFEANARSTYSNVAFSLLGLALENVTGKAYLDVISSSILEPLKMRDTSFIKPKDSSGIIPYGVNHWTVDLGANRPSGGIYSTANDFSKYLRSILTSSLLPKAVINAWMKPHSWAFSGVNSAFGMPWEILRSTKLSSDGRAIDVITKDGALLGYFSTIALIPEFGLGITILVAGDSTAHKELKERMVAAVVPAIERVARSYTKADFSGVYVGREDMESSSKSSLALEVDEIGPGMRITSWISNGTDFLEVYGRLKGAPENCTAWEARLLPIGLQHNDSTRGVYWETWRAVAVPKKSDQSKNKIFDDLCITDVDSVMYGGWSVEEFWFMRSMNDGHGVFPIIVLPGLRQVLYKGEKSFDNYHAVTQLQHHLSSLLSRDKPWSVLN
ncbi:hypothetical protein MMC13_007637 [Lambiella insularis]|nr:hypothetical protein [Lambiella insularis]